MPSPVDSQSAIRTPLNRLLGREAFVRVLRVLCESPEPLQTGEIAEEASLSARSVRQVLKELEAEGIVERIGSGKARPARLDSSHPLAAPLSALFQAEDERFQDLLERLRDAVAKLAPDLLAAWIHGPVARRRDSFGDPIPVGVLASSRKVDQVTERLQQAATKLGGEHAVLIDVIGYTRPDLAALSGDQRRELEQRFPLYGPSPLSFLEARVPALPATSHEDLDERSRRLARAVAQRLAEDPGIRKEVLASIRSQLEDASESERRELHEWRDAFEHLPTVQLRQLLTAGSERARRLRQSLPFTGLFDPEELQQLLDNREVEEDA